MNIKRSLIIIGALSLLTACEDTSFTPEDTSTSTLESLSSEYIDAEDIVQEIAEDVEEDVNTCKNTNNAMTEEDSYERLINHLTEVSQSLEDVDSSDFDDQKLEHLANKKASIDEFLAFVIAEGSLTDDIVTKLEEMRNNRPKIRRRNKPPRLNGTELSCEQRANKHKIKEQNICSKIENDIEQGKDLPDYILEAYSDKCD